MSEFVCNTYKIVLNGQEVSSEFVAQAASEVNRKLRVQSSFPEGKAILIAAHEGGGGLSNIIGALLIDEISLLSNGNLAKNPYNSGNPDILNLASKKAKEHYMKFTIEKNGFRVSFDGSEFGTNGHKYKFKGIEVKCTFVNGKMSVYGETGITSSKRFNWNAHHNDNDNLMGIVCDFVNGVPQIVLIMFSFLEQKDWGKINDVTGTKNTNTCSLNKYGLEKMKNRWLCIYNDNTYLKAFEFPIWRDEFENTPPVYDIEEEDSDYELW